MNKEILRLAIPNIISNVSVPLLSTVDIIFMGTLSGLHIGAVGIGAMIFSFLFWNFGFLRMGTTGMTAQAFGRGDEEAISLQLQRATFVAIFIGVILLVGSPLLFSVGASLMNVAESQYDMVSMYFMVGIVAAPATLLLFALKGWFFGMQNAILPLVLTIFINLVNIGLSYYFVIIRGWEIAGVAWGTVIAQYLGLTLCAGLIVWKYRPYLIRFPMSVIMKKSALKGFFKINGDIFIRTLCLSFTFGFFYSRSSAYGEVLLAANVILMQLLNWMSYGIDGFAYAAESLVGKYYGANSAPKLMKSIRLSLIWGFGLALFFSGLYGLGSEAVLGLFTKDKEVLEMGLYYLPWMILLPIAGFASYIWDGIYVGVTATTAMRNTMFLALIVFLGTYYLGREWIGPNHGLWLALLLFLLSRGAFQWWWFSYRWVRPI